MGVMNRLFLISPEKAWGFKPMISGEKREKV
jgi:hypothetical protein